MTVLDYERDGASIYAASFAIIRAESDLSGVATDLEPVVVRMIHACGDVDIVSLVDSSSDFVTAAKASLAAGRPIWCDSNMVAHGITRRRLPAGNPVRCTLNDDGIRDAALAANTTRSAAAVDRWLTDIDGSLAVIGNAPTALFRLLELVLDGAATPAAIIGIPVGFVGAAESKDALTTLPHGIPYLTVLGRRGGSAMASAAVNALAGPEERQAQ
jgi:precorrin-8X/cobalt-precorrin-8 methylmutase